MGTDHILGFDPCLECREQLKKITKEWIDGEKGASIS
jgi:hypothetical protein